jgi:uncharacterized delta-60 repeat protein
MRKLRAFSALLVLSAAMVACGSNNVNPTPPPPPPAADFSIEQVGENQDVGPGSEVTLPILLNRKSNFSEVVKMRFENPPVGLTEAWSLDTANGDYSVKIKIPDNAPAGILSLPINGTLLADSASNQGLRAQATQGTVAVNVVPGIGTFAVSATPAIVEVPQGKNTSLSVLVKRSQATLNSGISFNITGKPSGVTLGSLNSLASNTPNDVARTLTITVANSVAIGTYVMKLEASASGTGATKVSTNIVLKVLANSSSFDLSLVRSEQSIPQGLQRRNILNVVREPGFTFPLTLSAVNAPAGSSITFLNPTLNSSANSATFDIKTASNTAPGVYPITLKATSNGIVRTIPYNLTVSTFAGQKFTVDLLEGDTISEIAQGGGIGINDTENKFVGITVNPGNGSTVQFTGLPEGVRRVLSSDFSLPVTADYFVAAGEYPINVVVTREGYSETIPLKLKVNAKPTTFSSDSVGLNELDTSYGPTGQGFTRLLAQGVASAGLPLADGRLIFPFAAMVKANGRLDFTVSGNGTAEPAVGETGFVRILANGGGGSGGGGVQFATARYSINTLKLDSSFGVTFDGFSTAAGILADKTSDGKLIMLNFTNSQASNPDSIVRLNANSQRDTSFDGDGLATLPAGSGPVADAAVDSQNRVVVLTISTFADGRKGLNVLRLNSNGSLDTSFGLAGKVATDVVLSRLNDTNGIDNAHIALDGQGRIVIVVAGGNRPVGTNGFTDALVMLRLNSTGLPDSSFGSAGKMLLEETTGFSVVKKILLLPSGQWLLGGSSGALVGNGGSGASLGFATRINANGTVDTSFGAAGKLRVALSHGGRSIDTRFANLELQNGKVVAFSDPASFNEPGRSSSIITAFRLK